MERILILPRWLDRVHWLVGGGHLRPGCSQRDYITASVPSEERGLSLLECSHHVVASRAIARKQQAPVPIPNSLFFAGRRKDAISVLEPS